MENKNSFILYVDYYESLKFLNLEQKGALFDALFLFQMGEENTIKDPAVNMAYSFITSDMRRNNEKYEKVIERRREAGRKGGYKKQENLANVANASFARQSVANLANASKTKQTLANLADNVDVNDNDNDNVNDNDPVNVVVYVNDNVNDNVSLPDADTQPQNNNNTKGKKPLIHEIKLELLKLGAQMDDSEINAFMDYNDERGWRLNWQYALKRWVDNQKQKPEDMHSDDFWDSLLKGET